MLLERHISNIEEWKFPTINDFLISLYEPYEHVLCHPPPRLRLYTPTQLALAPGPSFLFLGKRTVGAWGGGICFWLIESISLLSLLTEPAKKRNRSSFSCRESCVGDIFIWRGGFVVRLLINDVRMGRPILGILKKKRGNRITFFQWHI